ncbi:HNH endonuclease [Halorussus lipolyticus]|uniref:HNH endonuclease n=1 Tax=Halorussus lipolyticus TaxID=3034024 RepID=UPI0023E82152|nr:HNH endonuclease [Halorussus sp. DT80]
MTWKDDVYVELLRYTEANETKQFTLPEFYRHAEDRLAAKHPQNNNVQAKIRQILQQLRDGGQLEFVDDSGTYRLVELDEEFMAEYGVTEYDVTEYGVTQRTVETTRYPMPQSVRIEALQRYDKTCLLTDVDLPELLDAAHVVARSERPSEVRNPENVFVVNKLYHEAFDRGLFTIDTDYRLRVKPTLSTESELLHGSLMVADGERVEFPEPASLDTDLLAERNAELAWA